MLPQANLMFIGRNVLFECPLRNSYNL